MQSLKSFFQLSASPNSFQHQPVQTVEEFRDNLESRFQFSSLLRLDQFQWKLHPNQKHSNYLLAGGAALNAVQVEAKLTEESDLDIFVLAGHPDDLELQREAATQNGQDQSLPTYYLVTQAGLLNFSGATPVPEVDRLQRLAAFRLCQHLASVRPRGEVWFGVKNQCIHVWVKGLKRPIQIVLIPDSNKYEDILGNFDQSACAWGYDGTELWCTFEAVSDLMCGTNSVNIERYNRLTFYNPDKNLLGLARRIRKMVQKGFKTAFKEIDWCNRDLYPDATEEEQRRTAAHPFYTSNALEWNRKLLPDFHLTMDVERVYVVQFARPEESQGKFRGVWGKDKK